MNIPILITACITLLTFLAHLIVGSMETAQLQPKRLTTVETISNYDTVERHWMQSMCAFQIVSVDLLVVAILLFAIALTDWVPLERIITQGLAVLFLLWAFSWLASLLWYKRPPRDYLLLSQWAFFLLCAGLLFWGAR